MRTVGGPVIPAALEINGAPPLLTTMKAGILVLAAATLFSRALLATEVQFQSGPSQTHLLELFTSEGCSSCPPAEAQLSHLKQNARLWHDFVPVAFHVDYWDRLGWRDSFSSKEWTERQYRYSSLWGSSSVYTPGFVVDGREAQGPALSASAGTVGVLKVSVAGDNIAAIDFQPAKTETGDYDVHLARLAVGVSSDVKAGENRGRKLAHDFVVRSLQTDKLVAGKAQLKLPAGEPSDAIAVWVTKRDQLVPIQAAGAFLR